MPTFLITDPSSGRKVRLTGDSAPTEQELEQIFSELPPFRKPTPVPKFQEPTVLGGLSAAAASITEPAAALITGAALEPVAGLAGLASTVFNGAEAGARTIEDIRGLAFQPQTEAGQASTQAIGESGPVRALQATEQFFGDTLEQGGQSIGLPPGVGGAVGKTIPATILTLAGAGPARSLSRAPAKLVRSGAPTAEFKAALLRAEAGDLSPATLKKLETLPAGTNADDAARAARFKEQGITATRGDITQDFNIQSGEQRLLQTSGNRAADELRAVKGKQSIELQTAVNDLVDSLGLPAEAGVSAKKALSGKLKLDNKAKRALYKEFAGAPEDVKAIPVLTQSIEDVIPPANVLDDLAITAGDDAIASVEKLLTKYGIVKDQVSVEQFLKGVNRKGQPNQLTPLNVGNFDQFRKSLNGIKDPTGALSVFVKPIKTALDNEGALLDAALRSAGVSDSGLLATLKSAQKAHRAIKIEFSPDQLRGKLTSFKRDGVTPTIENTAAGTQILKSSPEELARVVESLKKSPNGDKALGNLRAKVIFDALEDTLKAAPSNKLGGIQQFNGTQFAKRLDKIDGTLKILFKDDPAALRRLRGLRKTGKDTSAAAGAVPLGSTAFWLAMGARLSKIPGAGLLASGVKFLANVGGTDRALRKALNTRPRMRPVVTRIQDEFPKIAAALGVSGISASTREPLTITIRKSAKDFTAR